MRPLCFSFFILKPVFNYISTNFFVKAFFRFALRAITRTARETVFLGCKKMRVIAELDVNNFFKTRRRQQGA